MKAFCLYVAASPFAKSFTLRIRRTATIFTLLLLAANARAVNGPNKIATNGFP